MLSRDDNELITRIEDGAPMGMFLRAHYWFPAALSVKLAAGGAPRRARLLGEDFVVFRATDGRVGFFDERCPHRGASLALARNEDNALRCIYHGWKYGVDGTVLDVPTAHHAKAEFCKRVPLRHYPVREACGIVWVWLGGGTPADFPEFEFNNLPADRSYVVHQTLGCNWLQDLEGGMDSAHVSVLHQSWLADFGAIALSNEDQAPVYEFEPQVGGYRYVALRQLKDGRRYARVNQFVMPWYSLICPEEFPHGDRLVIMSTPVDDTRVVHWMIRYNPYRTLGPSYANPASDPGNWPPAPPGGPDTAWGQDRLLMARGVFTGFRHLNTEDFAVALSQGPIADRSKEFLNEGDFAVVRLRRLLLDAVKEFQKGLHPESARHENIPYPKIRASAAILGAGEDWHALSA